MTHTTDSSLEELGPAVLVGSLHEPFLAYNPLPLASSSLDGTLIVLTSEGEKGTMHLCGVIYSISLI